MSYSKQKSVIADAWEWFCDLCNDFITHEATVILQFLWLIMLAIITCAVMAADSINYKVPLISRGYVFDAFATYAFVVSIAGSISLVMAIRDYDSKWPHVLTAACVILVYLLISPEYRFWRNFNEYHGFDKIGEVNASFTSQQTTGIMYLEKLTFITGSKKRYICKDANFTPVNSPEDCNSVHGHADDGFSDVSKRMDDMLRKEQRHDE